MEELLQDDVVVFEPRLRLDCVEPGGEELLPCQARGIHIHHSTTGHGCRRDVYKTG